jgi:Fe-S cluster assembly iron-binding protein IscA
MATYLTLANRVLNDLNEVELTSANFSSSRGVQTSVKNFVNRALHDIYNEVEELPSLHKETFQDTNAGQREYELPTADSPQSGDLQWRKIDWDTVYLKPKELITNGEFTSDISSWTTIAGSGSVAYNSGGNGRLRLNDFAAHQSFNTRVNTEYRLQVRAFDSNSTGQALKVQVGTAAEGTQNLNTTLTVTDFGEGEVLDTTFTATAQTTFITLNNTTTATNMDVDYVRVSRNISPKRLRYISYDDYVRQYAERDKTNLSSAQGEPKYVYKTQSGKLGLSPVPDRSDYSVVYEYFKEHSELSAHGDTPDLDDRYADLIVTRARYYAYNLRSDPEHAMIAQKEFKDGMKRLRSDLVTKQQYMRDERVNLRYYGKGIM